MHLLHFSKNTLDTLKFWTHSFRVCYSSTYNAQITKKVVAYPLATMVLLPYPTISKIPFWRFTLVAFVFMSSHLMGLSTTNRFNPFRKFAAENVGSQTRNKSRIIIYRAIFNLVSKVICIQFDWLRYCALWLVRKPRAIFSASEKQNQKRITTCSLTFSRALCRLYVFTWIGTMRC